MFTPAKRINRYKTEPGQWFFNFPSEIDPLSLEVHRFHQGERMDTAKIVGLNLFDSVQYLYTSFNAKDQKKENPFFACLGYNDQMKKQVFLVCKLKKRR